MKITFMGAARTVSGSCYILECGGKRFALDCGLHQGNKEIEKRNWNFDDYDAKKLDFILITHAHIDHSGLLPALVSKGYKNPIYCTAPTKDLLEIMLLDSAHIQEMEAEWSNRKRQRTGIQQVRSLYSITDAENTIPLLAPVEYTNTFEPAPGIKVTYMNAGHILGSAFIEIEYEEDGKLTTAVFSGDLGRPEQLIVADPSDVVHADYIFLESTYGNRNHPDEEHSLDELAQAIEYSYKNKEKVVIPAFAVERSQQIIYSLFLLNKQGRLPLICQFISIVLWLFELQRFSASTRNSMMSRPRSLSEKVNTPWICPTCILRKVVNSPRLSTRPRALPLSSRQAAWRTPGGSNITCATICGELEPVSSLSAGRELVPLDARSLVGPKKSEYLVKKSPLMPRFSP